MLAGLHECSLLGQTTLMRYRRTAQTATAGGNEKDAVKSYFDNQGFERWNRIYGTTDDVNKVCQ